MNGKTHFYRGDESTENLQVDVMFNSLFSIAQLAPAAQDLPTNTDDLLAGRMIHLRQDVSLQVSHHAGKAPALVFLHGGLGNRFNWRSQYEFAHAQGWEVLAYDLAGHGQSLPYSRYSIGRHRRDLSRLLHLFEIRNPILCCHSYGVPIGLEWAQRHPTRGLLLIGGGTHELDPWWEIPLMKLMTWGGRHLYRCPLVQTLTNRLTSNHQTPIMDQFFEESPTPVEHHPYEALEIFWGYNFFTRRKTDWHLDVPTLVVTGGQDAMFTYEMGEALADHFRMSQHLHLPNAGHLVMAEYPDMVNQAIADWIHEQGIH
jgi:pimeloyl-ACP methyl ester carboxylesterase